MVSFYAINATTTAAAGPGGASLPHTPSSSVNMGTRPHNHHHHLLQLNVASSAGSIYISTGSGTVETSAADEATAAATSSSSYSGTAHDYTAGLIVIPGTNEPSWQRGSLEQLASVQSWISSEPDNDAIIIINVHGPFVENKKWIYATRLPYVLIPFLPTTKVGRTLGEYSYISCDGVRTRAECVLSYPPTRIYSLQFPLNPVGLIASHRIIYRYIQIEPAWLSTVSLGVLAARPLTIDAHVAAGHWPLPSLRFPDKMSPATVGGVMASGSTSTGENTTVKGVDRLTVAAADRVNQDIYRMLRTALNATLAEDTLVYKTVRGSFRYFPDGEGGLRPEAVDFTTNGPLVATFLLSGLLAAVLALAAGFMMRKLGRRLVLSYLHGLIQRAKEANLEKEHKADEAVMERNEDIEDDSKEESGEAEKRSCEVEMKEKQRRDSAVKLLSASKIGAPSLFADTEGGCGGIHEEVILQAIEQDQRGKKQRRGVGLAQQQQRSNNISDSGGGRLRGPNNFSRKFRSLARSSAPGKAQRRRGARSVFCCCRSPPDRNHREGAAGSRSSSRQDNTAASGAAGGTSMPVAVKTNPFDLSNFDAPSPFELPHIILGEFLEQKKVSLDEFLDSDKCFRSEDEHMWSTGGCTALARFKILYSRDCDLRGVQEVPIQKQKHILEKHGVTIESRLLPGIVGIRMTTKGERRKAAHAVAAGGTTHRRKRECVMSGGEYGDCAKAETYAKYEDHALQIFDAAKIIGSEAAAAAETEEEDCWEMDDFHSAACNPESDISAEEEGGEGSSSDGGGCRLFRCTGCRGVRRLAYHHFMHHSGEVVITGDDRDFVTLQALSQYFASYFYRYHKRRKAKQANPCAGSTAAAGEEGNAREGEGEDEDNSVGKGGEGTRVLLERGAGVFKALSRALSGTHEENDGDGMVTEQSAEEVVFGPELWALDIAQDQALGVAAMCRRDAYVLIGVEVLTAKEEDEREHLESRVGGTLKSGCGQFLKSLFYVSTNILICLVVPLPISMVCFAQQRLYASTTAVGREFVLEDILFSPQPGNILMHSIRIENAAILAMGLLYYLVSAVKLSLFFADFSPRSCLRLVWRRVWVYFTFFYFLLIFGYAFLGLMWYVRP